MAQDEPDNSDNPNVDGAKPDARKDAAAEGAAPLARSQRLGDEPESSGGDEAPAQSAPPKKSRLSLGWILLGLIVVAAAALAGAFALRDTNEDLRAFTDTIENAAREPLAAIKEKTLGAYEELKPSPPGVAVKEPAPVSEAPLKVAPEEAASQRATSQEAASHEAASQEAASKEAAPVSEPRVASESPREQTPTAAETPPARPQEPPEVAEGRAHEPALRGAEREALIKRIEDAEKLAQSALKAAEEARAARSESAEKPGSDSGALSERDYVTALEGRIDELASEIKAVREKLEVSKSELRAPQESAEAKSPPGKKGSAAELVVVAQSLNQEIEKGRPYSVELAALSALGADPELLAALAPSAEKGTMTHEQLLHGFEPVAKRLFAIDAPKSTGSYVDRVTSAVSRLVRIRPINEPPSATVSDHVEEIRTALKQGDVAAAAAAFDLLPDSAKTEESAFGELLRQRRDAEKASAALLSGAIAALGRNKS